MEVSQFSTKYNLTVDEQLLVLCLPKGICGLKFEFKIVQFDWSESYTNHAFRKSFVVITIKPRPCETLPSNIAHIVTFMPDSCIGEIEKAPEEFVIKKGEKKTKNLQSFR